MLQRVQKLDIPVGVFKRIENDFVGKSLQAKKDVDIEKQMMEKFIDDKCGMMVKEIDTLHVALKALIKTIECIKSDVKSRVSDKVFCMWWNRVDHIGKRFKKLYSDEYNNFYDYIYKTARNEKNEWYNIVNDINWIKENIFAELNNISELVEGFEEGDLENLFMEGVKNKVLKRKVRIEGDEAGMASKNARRIEDKGVVDMQSTTNDQAKDQISRNIEYDNVSSDDEDQIISGVLLSAARDDEVGEVDMADFDEFIEKYVGDEF